MIKHLNIQAPIWKDRSVGIATYLLIDADGVEINILYTKKDGQRLYPNPFFMLTPEIKKFPKQKIGNVTVHLVPINCLQELICVPK